MSKYYRKINSPYKRDKKGVFIPEFADPVFEEHLDSVWAWTYKWDGTSVGFEVGGEVFGRTPDSALSWEQWKTVLVWQQYREGLLENGETYVYGELVGPDVQRNPHGLDRLAVMQFDSRSGENYLGLGYQQDIAYASLREAIDKARTGFLPDLLPDGDPRYFEGVVGRLVDDPNVITKLKVKDRWSW